MKDSIIKNKTILAIDSNMDVLSSLEKEILSACPECRYDKATTFNNGSQYMSTFSYDLVISDIMSYPGADLIDLTASHAFPVLSLLSNGHSSEALNYSNGLRIRAVLNKHNIKELVPTIEQVLKLERASWDKLVLKKPGRLFKLGPT